MDTVLAKYNPPASAARRALERLVKGPNQLCDTKAPAEGASVALGCAEDQTPRAVHTPSIRGRRIALGADQRRMDVEPRGKGTLVDVIIEVVAVTEVWVRRSRPAPREMEDIFAVARCDSSRSNGTCSG